MSRRAALFIVVGALISLLFATVTTSGKVEFAERAPTSPDAPGVVIDDTTSPAGEPPQLVPVERRNTSGRIPATILLWLGATGAALVVLYVLYLLRDLFANIPGLRWSRRFGQDTAFDVLPDVAAAVVDEADAQRAELLAGEPRNAIVRCWLRLEHDVASVGLVRHRAQTSAEFTESVLAGYSVDGEAIRTLARLYREARFSRHELGETARSDALDALDRLHQSLIVASSEPSVDDMAAAR
ncbi:MAG: DUF4129 domain-containing protein [Acidimicrobiales bacterium]